MQEFDLSGRFAVELAVGPDPRSPVREFQHRRYNWHKGCRVCLTDGAFWWLPPIDCALVATCPPFRLDANKALDLLAVIREQTLKERESFLPLAIYHAQMANMGLNLLRENYDMTEDSWRTLTRFTTATAALHYTKAVGEAFAASSESWMPFLTDRRFVL